MKKGDMKAMAMYAGLVPQDVLVDLYMPVKSKLDSLPSQETHLRDEFLAKAQAKRERRAAKLQGAD